MTTERIRAKLDPLINTTIQLPDAKVTSINGYRINDNKTVTLFTSTGSIVKDESEIELFSERVKVVSTGSAALATQVENVLPLNGLNEILMNTIGRLQTEPGFVDQAKAINDTAKNIIDIAKTRIDALKLLKEQR